MISQIVILVEHTCSVVILLLCVCVCACLYICCKRCMNSCFGWSFVQAASTEWFSCVQVQLFKNLYNPKISNGSYCCCYSNCIKLPSQQQADKVAYWLSIRPGRWGWARVGIAQQAFLHCWLLMVLLTSSVYQAIWSLSTQLYQMQQ